MRFVLFAVLAAFFFIPAVLVASDQDGVTARSYILVEKESFRIVAGKDYHRRLHPASTTKVMTALIAVENLSGNETIVPNNHVSKIPPSKMNLVPGRRYKAIDIMKGALVRSANDAAYALAAHIAGSETAFARIMTERAREIGAIDTNFQNASGLPGENHYTTSYDLALIFRHALANEILVDLLSTKYFNFQDGTRRMRYQNNNRLLFCFDPTICGKTGYTRLSRHCYVGAFEKDGKTYILALLGSENLWGDNVQILRTIYDRLPTDAQLRQARAANISIGSTVSKPKSKKTVTRQTAVKHRAVKPKQPAIKKQ